MAGWIIAARSLWASSMIRLDVCDVDYEIQNMILFASCLIDNLFIHFSVLSFIHSFIRGGSVVRVLTY